MNNTFSTCLLIIQLVSIFILGKNTFTLSARNTIQNAIYVYRISCIQLGVRPKVHYNHAESYFKTLFRFWDFGCKHILPPDKFQIIESYIIKR